MNPVLYLRGLLHGVGGTDAVGAFDLILGTIGVDTLDGTDRADTINALSSNDVIRGSLGADRIDGGQGMDRVDYSREMVEGVTVILGGGLSGVGTGGLAEGDVLVSVENVTGTQFDDIIVGDDRDNVLEGFAGANDTLKGAGGDDTLRGIGLLDGGEGDDDLRAFQLADTLKGGEGDDRLDGGEGADRLDGGAGVDTAVYDASEKGVTVFLGALGIGFGGEAEGDTLVGIENVLGTERADRLTGDQAVNRLEGGGRDDVLMGLGQDDALDGGSGNDTLDGGTGNDLLTGGEGADVLNGGAGSDTAEYGASRSGVFVDLAGNRGTGGDALGDTFLGIERVRGSALNDSLMGDGLANEFSGGAGADTLKGFGGMDELLGGDGADTLSGGDGADRLDGGEDVDRMTGGAGDDLYVVDSRADVIDELALFGSGNDTIQTSITYTLNDSDVRGDVENLTLSGTGNVNATGNALANTLFGNAGANLLDGREGADRMAGRGGNDRYTVDNVGDVVEESTFGIGGIDRVSATVSFSLSGSQVKGTVENLTLFGNGAINGSGNAGANAIDGNSAANELTGLGGNDTLRGGLGSDTFVFNAALNAATNVDIIEDFDVAQDSMRLENAFMTALSTGQLATRAFHIGAAAHDASDRIVYNANNGDLSYDADGTGAVAAIRFANLDAGLSLTSADFFVV